MIYITFRPIETWPDGLTPDDDRRSPGLFRGSTYEGTVNLLTHELSMLGVTQVVIQLAMGEEQIRRDGMPRAKAQTRHPGVIVSFRSHHGPLRYATDLFATWQANLRAIALGLEALRKVDRYGISRGGEQYRGWLALESGNGVPLVERGRRLIAEHGGSVAAALKATHPDHGGTEDDLRAVVAAREAGA